MSDVPPPTDHRKPVATVEVDGVQRRIETTSDHRLNARKSTVTERRSVVPLVQDPGLPNYADLYAEADARALRLEDQVRQLTKQLEDQRCDAKKQHEELLSHVASLREDLRAAQGAVSSSAARPRVVPKQHATATVS